MTFVERATATPSCSISAASADPQRVLDVARGAGDVVSFGAVRLTLAELFREVVS